MAKFYGIAGYKFDNVEIRPGVWTSNIVEKPIYGELIRNTKKTENQGQFNDTVNINNQVSFVADPYAIDNFHNLKYVTFMGSKWAIKSIEVAFPRLILNLGGVYNDEQQTCSS